MGCVVERALGRASHQPTLNHLTVLLEKKTFVSGAVKMRGMREEVWELGECCNPIVGMLGEWGEHSLTLHGRQNMLESELRACRTEKLRLVNLDSFCNHHHISEDLWCNPRSFDILILYVAAVVLLLPCFLLALPNKAPEAASFTAGELSAMLSAREHRCTNRSGCGRAVRIKHVNNQAGEALIQQLSFNHVTHNQRAGGAGCAALLSHDDI